MFSLYGHTHTRTLSTYSVRNRWPVLDLAKCHLLFPCLRLPLQIDVLHGFVGFLFQMLLICGSPRRRPSGYIHWEELWQVWYCGSWAGSCGGFLAWAHPAWQGPACHDHQREHTARWNSTSGYSTWLLGGWKPFLLDLWKTLVVCELGWRRRNITSPCLE